MSGAIAVAAANETFLVWIRAMEDMKLEGMVKNYVVMALVTPHEIYSVDLWKCNRLWDECQRRGREDILDRVLDMLVRDSRLNHSNETWDRLAILYGYLPAVSPDSVNLQSGL